MPHIIPNRLKLLKELLLIVLWDIHVHDPNTAARLSPYEGLHIICNQLQLVLENKLSSEHTY